MWIRCNPNPVGKETGDCVIRALAIATNRSWREVFWDLCDIGAKEGELPNANVIWGKYLKQHGGKQFLLPESCPECLTVEAFCERYPKGVYVIGTGEHAVTCIDSDWYDIFDSGRMTPTYFWRMK